MTLSCTSNPCALSLQHHTTGGTVDRYFGDPAAAQVSQCTSPENGCHFVASIAIVMIPTRKGLVMVPIKSIPSLTTPHCGALHGGSGRCLWIACLVVSGFPAQRDTPNGCHFVASNTIVMIPTPKGLVLVLIESIPSLTTPQCGALRGGRGSKWQNCQDSGGERQMDTFKCTFTYCQN